VTVAASGADVMHALVTPEVMTQWMVGVDSVSEMSTTETRVGTRVEVTTRLGSGEALSGSPSANTTHPAPDPLFGEGRVTTTTALVNALTAE